MADPLKLRAEDEEDLAVVSTILQDALVPVGEMAYLPEEKRFVLVANRFKWEAPPLSGGRLYERAHVGIAFDEVEGGQDPRLRAGGSRSHPPGARRARRSLARSYSTSPATAACDWKSGGSCAI